MTDITTLKTFIEKSELDRGASPAPADPSHRRPLLKDNLFRDPLFTCPDELVKAINANFAILVSGGRTSFIFEEGNQVHFLDKAGVQNLLRPCFYCYGDDKTYQTSSV